MSDGGWAVCLDRFEAHLRGQFQALADGRPERIVPFPSPSPGALGELPVHLRARAQEVAAEGRRLEQELSAAAACSARHLQLLAVLGGQRAGRRTASYVDDRG